MNARDSGGYPWNDGEPSSAHDYLLPVLEDLLRSRLQPNRPVRVLDIGCGNGAVTAWLANRGFDVVGVDPSEEGIARARAAHPKLTFHQRSAYEPLHEDLGRFQLVVCLEVVEHVYDPPSLARTVFDVLEPGGLALVSTPFHGWLKNAAIAFLGKFDRHVDPLRMHGHIKFWSPTTLTRLLEGVGLEVLEYRYAGRIRPLAKSMVAVSCRPADSRTPSADPPLRHR